MIGVLIKTRNLKAEMHTGKVSYKLEDSHLQAKKQGLKQTLP